MTIPNVTAYLTLLPCPFCGTDVRDDEQLLGLDAWLQVSVHAGSYSVECFGCGVKTRGFGRWEEAIKAWNRRMPPSAVNPLSAPLTSPSLEWPY